jgi:LysR family glycine cleavage system transcriptional activator
MNWRAMPPLASLRAFAALAEARSVSAAGQMLNVSHAAVSQQIRALEAHLGVRLVARNGRGVILTNEGAQLARAVTEGFAAMARAVEEITGADAERPLQISTTPAFAANWLMPRIGDFRCGHPDVDLMLNPTADLVDLTPGGIDIGIRFGNGDWPGLDVDLLFHTDIVVVAAKSLIGDREISEPADLTGYPWLQEFGTNEASDWLESRGVTERRMRGLTQVPGHLVLDGLRAGQGVVATTRAFIETDIAAGTVRVLFGGADPDNGYWIVTRPGVLRPAARAFVAWLRRQSDSGSQGHSPRIVK